MSGLVKQVGNSCLLQVVLSLLGILIDVSVYYGEFKTFQHLNFEINDLFTDAIDLASLVVVVVCTDFVVQF